MLIINAHSLGFQGWDEGFDWWGWKAGRFGTKGGVIVQKLRNCEKKKFEGDSTASMMQYLTSGKRQNGREAARMSAFNYCLC